MEHTDYALFFLGGGQASFILHNYFEIRPYYYMYQWFLFISGWYSIAWIYFNLFVHLPVGTHLNLCQILAFTNKATLNSHVQFFIRTYTFISLGGYFFKTLPNFFPKQQYLFTFPQQCMKVLAPAFLPNT